MPEYDPIEVERHEKSTWESTAGIYAGTAGFLTALSGQLELVVEFGKINKGSHVLDLGCGPGQLTHALSKEADRVEGVDFAGNMIHEARAAFPELTFQVANGEDLPFDDSTFDVVVCNYTAHHFARPEIVFDEVLRSLKPSGCVVIIHPIQAEQVSWGSFSEALNEVLPPGQIPHGPLGGNLKPFVRDKEDFESLLAQCGYSNVRCEKRVKPLVLSSIDVLLDAGWKIAGLHDQSKEVQDQIRAGTIDRAEEYKTPDGTYDFRYVVLVATGHR